MNVLVYSILIGIHIYTHNVVSGMAVTRVRKCIYVNVYSGVCGYVYLLVIVSSYYHKTQPLSVSWESLFLVTWIEATINEVLSERIETVNVKN